MSNNRNQFITYSFVLLCWGSFLGCKPTTPTQSTPSSTAAIPLHYITESQATLPEVLAKAQAERKLVFIDFYATWCGPCKWMDKNVFTDPAVVKLYNQHFVTYKVDAEDFEGIDTAIKYRVEAYPTFVYINPASGEVVQRIEGMIPLESFLQLSNEIVRRGR